ncbi:StbB family protein [Arsenophonus nasoniae]|uniref:Uncharacterized protein n=2 Tax=Arsenophonus nasoniae TaxID=638 RepID=A0A4P7L2C3_9GAMM|nr:StbB family protein [Arsenophonus nasoniae]QBY46877.1 hypothetical protein ArsFIN_54880 [Arsenophonus nasoniae]
MKIVVLNNSGNVGKSTLCQHMLYPRLSDCEVLRVETLNSDGESTGEKLSASEFDSIFETILGSNNIIVDVGSSNMEQFSSKLKNEFSGSHIFIDTFIIPVTPDEKQQQDTITTILLLNSIGVQNENIKIIFNRVNPQKKISSQFSTLFENKDLATIGFSLTENTPTVLDSSLFATLKKAGISYNYIRDMDADFKSLVENAEDKKEKAQIQLMQFYRMGFDSYQKNLQSAFNALNLTKQD